MNFSQKKAFHNCGLGPSWHLKLPKKKEQPQDCSVYISALSLSEETQPSTLNLAKSKIQADVSKISLSTIEEKTSQNSWETIKKKISSCQACVLCKTRTRTVFGSGNHKAKFVVIGEAPGMQEDIRGEPFVGPAGVLLDRMLHSIGLNRERDVFILNILKCRPPQNRNPDKEEIESCLPFLREQLLLIKPLMLIALGKFSACALLQKDETVLTLRGKVHSCSFYGPAVPMIVSYHPAYLLRNPLKKKQAWIDFCQVQSLISEFKTTFS